MRLRGEKSGTDLPQLPHSLVAPSQPVVAEHERHDAVVVASAGLGRVVAFLHVEAAQFVEEYAVAP